MPFTMNSGKRCPPGTRKMTALGQVPIRCIGQHNKCKYGLDKSKGRCHTKKSFQTSMKTYNAKLAVRRVVLRKQARVLSKRGKSLSPTMAIGSGRGKTWRKGRVLSSPPASPPASSPAKGMWIGQGLGKSPIWWDGTGEQPSAWR